MKTTSLLLILVGCVTYGQGRLIHDDVDAGPSPSVARKLGVGLNPTLPPFEPPGFKPTTTPTDRTKRPTFRPSPRPTLPLPPSPTRVPTAPYRCGLCRETESPKFPRTTIMFKGREQTCAFVDALGDLTNKINIKNCNFYRLVGQQVCGCSENANPVLNNCTLCESGRSLPFPKRMVLGKIRCETIETSAKQDKRGNCVRYQGGIGSYCGCVNPVSSKQVCRLCGVGKRLPVPSREVNGLSCIEHEFLASNCTATKKAVGDACCAPA